MLGQPARTYFKSSLIFLLLANFFFISASPIQAAITLSFSSPPISLNVDDSFILNIKLEGASANSEYYIRGSFFSPNSPANYFGFTRNNLGEWNNTPSQFTSYFKIVGNGEWQIEFKPDKTSTVYSGPGNYQFKVGRYTPGGSLTWSNQSPADIHLFELSSSPTPSPSPTPSDSPTPTINSTFTPPPTTTATPSPTSHPSSNPKILIIRNKFQLSLQRLLAKIIIRN